ncbi:MAG: PAS domain S-box protein [Methanoregula sp.]
MPDNPVPNTRFGWLTGKTGKILGLVLIPLSLGSIVILASLNLTAVYEFPFLLLALNTIFIGVISLVIAHIAGRTYLRSGSASIFMMGSGLLVFGLGSIVTGWVIPTSGGSNAAVTIYNTCACMSSLLILAGAALSLRGLVPWKKKGEMRVVAAAYAAILVFVALFSLVTVQGLTPLFFIQGVGPTVLRQVILENTIVFFGAASVLVMVAYRWRRSDFFIWYTISLALIAIGLLGVLIPSPVGSLIGWTGRFIQYLGFVTALYAVLIARQESKEKHLPLETVLANFFVDAEQNYRQLVETANDAIVTFDEDNRILVWNAAAERMFGYTQEEAIGSSFPDLVIDTRFITVIEKSKEDLPQGDLSAGSMEISCKQKDGMSLPVELTISRRWQEGRLVRTVILRDLTVRKRLEAELEAANEALEAKVQERTAELGRTTESLRNTNEQLQASNEQLAAAEEELRGQYTALAEQETRIRESEELFRLAFEHAGAGMTLTALDGRFLKVNETLCTMLGYPEEELLQKTFRDVTHPHDIASSNRQVDLTEKGMQKAFRFDKRYLHSDGHIIWAAVSSVLLHDDAGKQKFFITHIKDITERKEAEKTIAEAYDMIVASEAEIRQQYADLSEKDEAIRALNRDLEKRVDERTSELQAVNEELLATAEELRRQLQVTAEQERQLTESEERYRRLVNFSPDAIAVHQDGVYVYINPAGLRLFRATIPEEIIGKRVLDLIPAEDRDLIASRIRAVEGEGHTTPVRDVRALRLDGTIVDVQSTGTGILFQGRPAVMIVLRDITLRKQAEKAIEEARIKTEESLAQFESLYENAPIGFAFLDGDFRYQYINQHLAEMNGIPALSHIGRTSEEIIPEIWASAKPVFEQVRHSKTGVTNIEIHGESAASPGTTCYWLENIYPVSLPDGRFLGFGVVILDITRRKQAELSLEREIEKINILAMASQQLLVSSPTEQIVTAICTRLMQFLGCDIFFNYIIDDAKDTMHLNAYAGVSAETARTLSPLTIGSAVCGCVARDRSKIILCNVQQDADPQTDLIRSLGITAYACHPLMHQDSPIGTLSFGTKNRTGFTGDEIELMEAVSDLVAVALVRKQADESLRESENRFRALTETSPLAIGVSLPDGTFLYVNKAYEQLFGYTEEELEHVAATALWQNPEDRLGMIDAIREKGSVLNYKANLMRRDGTTFPALLSVSTIDYGGNRAVLGTVYDITRIVEAEATMRESEERLRSVLENSRDVIYRVNEQTGRYEYISPVVQELVGYTAQELMGLDRETSLAMIHPDDLPAFRAGILHLADSGHEELTYRQRAKNGEYRWLSNHMSLTRDNEDRPLYRTGNIRDITERRRTEEDLARLAAIVQYSDTAIIGKTPDGTITSWNGGAELMYGYTAQEMIGRNVSVLVPPGQPDDTRIINEYICSHKPVIRYETRRRTKIGDLICVSLTASPILDGQGNLTGVSTIAYDITGQKMAQEEIRRAYAYNRSLIEASLDPLITINPDGKITDMNSATIVATGFSREELIGTDFAQYFSEPEKANEGYKKVFQDGSITNYELQIRHKNGKTTPVLYNATVYRDSGGDIAGVLAAARDITERKKMIAQIEASLAEKETLLKEVHHRVKNNLQIITSIINLQLRKLDDPVVIEAMKDSQSRVRSMALVHEQLYRGESLAKIDIGNYIRALGTGLFQSYEASRQGITLDLDVPKISVDVNTAIPLGLICNELITNSLKYAFRDKKDGKLSISAAMDSAYLKFVVADNGIGLPEYITLENEATLGLRLVNTLTDQLDGTVTIDRTAGTKFIFSFPNNHGMDKPEGAAR